MSTDESKPFDAFSKLMHQYRDAVNDDELGDAEATVHEIFAAAAEWCDQNPSPDFDLTLAAGRFEENADWVGAESAYRQIHLLPSLEPHTASKAYSDLASLYRLVNRHSDALRHARLATAAARPVAPSTFLVMMLRIEARCLIGYDHIDLARAVLDEALSIIGDDKAYDQMRASNLTLLAECDVHRGRHADAERILEEAFYLLQPLSRMKIAAGIHSDLSRWWSAAAKLRAARNDRDGAVTAWQEAVRLAKHVASLPHAESVYTKVTVADMLKGLADSLATCDFSDSAAAALADRTTILRALGIPDADAE